GGTWLGITRKGRLAALTNYRDPAHLKDGAPSRGKLVSDFLRGGRSPQAYLRRLSTRAAQYNGFGLLVGTPDELCYFSNRGAYTRLLPGVHGMSNHLLDTPWPKVERGRQALSDILEKDKTPSPERMFALLADRTSPPDDRLPDTGVGLEWERVLSPLFIESPVYGTRSSTVLVIDRKGHVLFFERVFDSGADPWMTSRFDFQIDRK
ncbi:MAG: NRDE family protein, partial [Deltaproteobacteria bacterium]|nr:NRDE family protein [Deltaproteobacteria bacterium]